MKGDKRRLGWRLGWRLGLFSETFDSFDPLSFLQHHTGPGRFVVVLLGQFSGDEGCRLGLAALVGARRNLLGPSTSPRPFGRFPNRALTDVQRRGGLGRAPFAAGGGGFRLVTGVARLEEADLGLERLCRRGGGAGSRGGPGGGAGGRPRGGRLGESRNRRRSWRTAGFVLQPCWSQSGGGVAAAPTGVSPRSGLLGVGGRQRPEQPIRTALERLECC